MTDFDVRSGATVERLINRFGRQATLRRTSRAYDPEAGQTSAASDDFSIKISPPESFAHSLVDGTLIRGSDLRAHVAARSVSIIPDVVSDRLLIDDVSYEIIRVDSVTSGEETAFYSLHLRR